jgi:hypothetical protein
MGRPKGSKNKPKETSLIEPPVANTIQPVAQPVEASNKASNHKTDAYCNICKNPIGTDYTIVDIQLNYETNIPRNIYIHTKTECWTIYHDGKKL